MGAVAEGHDLAGPPVDPEVLGVLAELTPVAVGRGVEQEYLAVGRDGGAVEGDVARRGAGEALHRAGEAQQLVDGVGDAPGVVEQQGALVEMGREQLSRTAEHAGGGVVAAGHHGEGEAEDPQQRHGVATLAGGHELADGVVPRFAAAGLDERGEVVEQFGDGVGGREHVAAGVGGHDGVGPGVEPGAVGLGHAQVVGHDHAGQRLEQLGDDIAPARGPQPLEALDDEGAHGGLQPGYPPGREAAGHEAAELGVLGGIEHHHGAGLGEAGRVDVAVVEGEPLSRREGGGVAGRREHVGEAREHEVVAVVHVVDRVGVTQRGVHRVGVAPGLRRPGHEGERV